MNQTNNIADEMFVLNHAKKILKYQIFTQFIYILLTAVIVSIVVTFININFVRIMFITILFIVIILKAYRITILFIAIENVDDEIKKLT
ncbi:hypothetical protein [Macrococcus capreoli]|uniref:hypothetical protein n=1 Tax=Macrococcus capreoli TaxID=2982690 RepID=UPI003F4230AC